MAPPKKPGPPLSYTDWKNLGCPPLELSVAHVAEWCGLNRMQINNYCKNGALVRADGKIKTDHPTNRQWLLDRYGYQRSELHLNAGRPAADPANPRSATPRQRPAPTPPPNEEMEPCPYCGVRAHGSVDAWDPDAVLDAIATLDFGKINSNAVQKVERIERAAKIRVDRQMKRGDLIERSLVSSIFAKFYQVDTNELLPLSQKMSATICAEMGIEDPETLLKIEQKIHGEILKVLQHIKRLKDDFLTGCGAEIEGVGLPEEVLLLLERVANTLGGMLLDPAIPTHAKDAMTPLIAALESAAE